MPCNTLHETQTRIEILSIEEIGKKITAEIAVNNEHEMRLNFSV